MSFAERFIGRDDLQKIAYDVELRSDLFASGFDSLPKRIGVPDISLATGKGIKLIDVEYGSDFLGMVKLLSKSGHLRGSQLSISESESFKYNYYNQNVDEFLSEYSIISKEEHFNLDLVRSYGDKSVNEGIHGVIFWLNMFPEGCDRRNLIYRVKAVNDHISKGGYGLITQVENSMYEYERYEDALANEQLQGIDVQLVEDLGVVGMIGLLVKKY